MLPTPAPSSTSSSTALVSQGYSRPFDRLDTATVYAQLEAQRKAAIDELEKILADLDELKDAYIASIHRRFVELQKHHREVLFTLDCNNVERELAEVQSKGKLTAFLHRLSATFTGLFGSEHKPVLPPSDDGGGAALVLVDPSKPAHAIDRMALEEKVRADEAADKDAIEGIYESIHSLFDAYAGAIVRRFERDDAQQRNTIHEQVEALQAQELENESQRQAIATLVDTIREAFDLFNSQQQQQQQARL
ncbi:hypothetical protein DMC30DRAFT_447424 [Rhodotorula diobovata]|uniref:Uncharacterized protein n=1 Tax=Rhodotorula diobovata TaxID=5288 RepID=A0A5C5FUR3_9BASI|nr:hypothetical protein DMC30DRAFT_447424 [Rhodotorula diobovata]